MSDVAMPRLSDSMEEGTILKWLKSDGDEVSKGEELVEIETDKANMTYEADQDGTLEIVAKEGDTLPVGETIARIGEGGGGGGAKAEEDESEADQPEAEEDSEEEKDEPEKEDEPEEKDDSEGEDKDRDESEEEPDREPEPARAEAKEGDEETEPAKPDDDGGANGRVK